MLNLPTFGGHIIKVSVHFVLLVYGKHMEGVIITIFIVLQSHLKGNQRHSDKKFFDGREQTNHICYIYDYYLLFYALCFSHNSKMDVWVTDARHSIAARLLHTLLTDTQLM